MHYLNIIFVCSAIRTCYIEGLFDGSQLINAGASCYGTGCHGLRIGNRDRASVGGAGSLNFAVLLSGAPAQKPATCIFGLGTPPPTDLAFMGAPGCLLRTRLQIEVPGLTSGGNAVRGEGRVLLPAPIPNDNTLKGLILSMQIGAIDPNSKQSFPVVVTNGIEVKIR